MAGKLLSGLITNQSTGLENLPLAQRQSPKWILEPLRWLVVRYMQQAFVRIDEATEAGNKPPADAFIAEFLGKH
jgi:hypothetical protein